MQMYLWTAPTPDFDGSLDADVIIHEYTHGLSNRPHGNSGGLSSNMARGMGEGWGDFYGHAMLSEPSDPINGIYTTGSYDTY
jgi:extracellular elastinolytic metalloproteinase